MLSYIILEMLLCPKMNQNNNPKTTRKKPPVFARSRFAAGSRKVDGFPPTATSEKAESRRAEEMDEKPEETIGKQ